MHILDFPLKMCEVRNYPCCFSPCTVLLFAPSINKMGFLLPLLKMFDSVVGHWLPLTKKYLTHSGFKKIFSPSILTLPFYR